MKEIVFASSNYSCSFDHNTPKLGGSESMLCNMALEMRKYFDKVIVFNHRNKSEKVDKIYYKPESKFKDYVSSNRIELLVISRDAHFTEMVANHPHVDKYFVWCHDFICRFGEPRIGRNFGGFILLSDYHTGCFKHYYGLKDDTYPIYKCPNFIDYDYIKTFKQPKVKKSFIYSSMFDRGAETLLLRYWMRILKKWPNATLSLCCDVPDKFQGFVKNESIVHVGRVSKEELYKKMWASEYWFYPSTFAETYCISALEAQACECICIHNGFAALAETIQSNQIMIKDNLITDIENHTSVINYDYIQSRNNNEVGLMFKNIITA